MASSKLVAARLDTEAVAITTPVVAWQQEHARLSERLRRAKASHSEAAVVAQAAAQNFEDNASDDVHVISRLRTAAHAARDSEADLTASLRGCERALDAHAATFEHAMNESLSRFTVWFDDRISSIARRYGVAAEAAASIISEALTLSSTAASVLPLARSHFDAMTFVPFKQPRTLTRNYNDGDDAETSLSATSPDISIAEAVMQILAPVSREMEQRRQHEHQAARAVALAG